MAEENSLCRVDWKLGQALMPGHFLWQEDSLRREWEERFAHQAKPLWGVFAIEWDEALLRNAGRLQLNRLQLVFESGLLIDIPGNATPVALDLPKDGHEPVDVYLYAKSAPEIAKTDQKLPEGNLVELRVQSLELSLQSSRMEPVRGFHLGRFRPVEAEDPGVGKSAPGWEWDLDYLPPLVTFSALAPFAKRFVSFCDEALAEFKRLLVRAATENTLAVHKRTEALISLRNVHLLNWRLRQLAGVYDEPESRGKLDGRLGSFSAGPTVGAHPFDVFEWLVQLYFDVHCFRSEPHDLLYRDGPRLIRYQHQALADCFGELRSVLEGELYRSTEQSREWAFVQDPKDSSRFTCQLPSWLREDSEVYFLVQFEGRRRPGSDEDQELDRQLLSLKLASPGRLVSVERSVLAGIPYRRLRLVPFPHNFDATRVHFYRLEPGHEWSHALREKAVVFRAEYRGVVQACFLYSPDAPASAR